MTESSSSFHDAFETLEQPALLLWLLLEEELVGITGQFEQLDAVFDVALVGVLVNLNGAQDSVLLASPVGGLAVEERSIDPSVELVQVHGVQACLNLVVVSLQAGDGLFALVLLVRMALAQCSGNPLDDIDIQCHALEGPSEPLREYLFPCVRFRALLPVAGAVVVDVALLLDLAHE